MAAGDATWNPKKNVAYRVTFPILDADGDLVSGATGLDSEVSKDGGTFADATNEATEIATSSGVYYLDLTATEMNADTVAIIVKTTSSGAKTTALVIYPLKDGDIVANVTQIAGQTASAAGAVTFIAAASIAPDANDAEVIPPVAMLTPLAAVMLVVLATVRGNVAARNPDGCVYVGIGIPVTATPPHCVVFAVTAAVTLAATIDPPPRL